MFEILNRSPHATPILDVLTYYVDTACWFLEGNRPVEVVARGQAKIFREMGYSAQDVTWMIITFEDGAVVNLGVCYILPAQYPTYGQSARFEVLGTEGVILLDMDNKDSVLFTDQGVPHAVASAIGGHVAWVVAMVREGKRPALDWGLRLVLTGTAFLVVATLMGLGLAAGAIAGPRYGLAYVVVALGGWASLTMAGMMLKIVPFLVWYRAYAPRVGRAPVPTLAQLSWGAGERAAATLLAAGVCGLSLAVLAGDIAWIRATAVVIATGALAFAATLARVLHHLMPCAARGLAPATGRQPS